MADTKPQNEKVAKNQREGGYIRNKFTTQLFILTGRCFTHGLDGYKFYTLEFAKARKKIMTVKFDFLIVINYLFDLLFITKIACFFLDILNLFFTVTTNLI